MPTEPPLGRLNSQPYSPHIADHQQKVACRSTWGGYLGMSDAADLNNLLLARVEQLLKMENLDADTALKRRQWDYEPWKVVVSAFAAGGVFFGALVAAIGLLFRLRVGG
jgi:hypothetical protein